MKAVDITDYLFQKRIEYEYKGDNQIEIQTISSLGNITNNSICWIKNKKYATYEVIDKICSTGSVLVVCPFEIEGTNCLITQYPKAVFFDILNKFFSKDFSHNISDKATVLTEKIGNNVHIGANCYIGEEVIIGDNTIIHPNVTIMSPCSIGHDCEIFPGVVIGSDGFGYYFEGDIPYREKHFKGVIIGNHVDIGSNTNIDRGLITDTVIGNNTKIDGLCKIGHNVIIEDNCLIIACSVLCGSAQIKKNSYIAPNSTVLNQVTVGNYAKVGVHSVAMKNVRDGATIMGVPGEEFLPQIMYKGGKNE